MSYAYKPVSEKIHEGNGDEITDVTEKQSEPNPSDNITAYSGHMSGIIGPQNADDGDDCVMSESKLEDKTVVQIQSHEEENIGGNWP